MQSRSIRPRSLIAAGAGTAALIALAVTHPRDVDAASSFTVLDNTAYADVSLGHGAVKTTSSRPATASRSRTMHRRAR